MLAATYQRYGPPSGLVFEQVPLPEPATDEVRIEVRAVSLNASDVELLTGTPAYARIYGLFRPKNRILGSDVAGVINAVGSGVTDFAVGDRVVADNFEVWGGFAEQCCVAADKLVRLPGALEFEVAAALPQAGVIARQGLARAREAKRVLINGAGGGSGTFAVQMAKAAGAHVTAVDAAHKLDTLTDLGADVVIDYRARDFVSLGERYDLILDLYATRSVAACAGALADEGAYLSVGGPMRTVLSIALYGPLYSLFSSRNLGILAVQPSVADLAALVEGACSGTIRPVIDQVVPLTGLPGALTRLRDGDVVGKVVVTP